jgi:hypothetical protein
MGLGSNENELPLRSAENMLPETLPGEASAGPAVGQGSNKPILPERKPYEIPPPMAPGSTRSNPTPQTDSAAPTSKKAAASYRSPHISVMAPLVRSQDVIGAPATITAQRSSNLQSPAMTVLVKAKIFACMC